MNILRTNKPLACYYRHIDRDNNFGIVRYILALGVIISHFNILVGADIPWLVYSDFRVGGFFTISGFLLTGSLLKGRTAKEFLIKRAKRLLPSYFTVVIVFAFLFCFISTLSLSDYFSSIQFWKYLAANLSFCNFLCPDLPGVFDTLSQRAVNGALWTMKIEWQLSFMILVLFYLCRRFRLNIYALCTIIIILSIVYRIKLFNLYESTGNEIYSILGRQLIGQSLFFFFGIILYCFYSFLKKYQIVIFLITALVYTTLKFYMYTDSEFFWLGLYPFLVSLLTISTSLFKGKFSDYIDFGHNISYEMYLCHYPIVQCAAYFALKKTIGLPLTFILCLISTIIVSIFIHIVYLRVSKQK